jgi:prepilin-type N-terminal cleavage/methylation domain-containing protein
MRKGFTLVEMLFVIWIIPVLMMVFSGMFHTLAVTVPLTWKAVQQNTVTLGMLSQMQQDVDKATGLPRYYGKFVSNDELLVIEQADDVICYQLKEGKIARLLYTDKNQSSTAQETTWKIPNTKIQWQIRNVNDKGKAVEVQSYIEQKISGRIEKKMSISHLFFVGVF